MNRTLHRKINLFSILIFLLVNAGSYAQAPNLEWAAALLTPSGFDITIPESVTSDPSGNIFTTGTFNGTTDFDPGAGVFTLTATGSSDIFISKLDANGDFTWAIQIGGTLFDSSNEITLDASGNIYVTGSFAGSVDFDPGASSTILTGPAGFVAKFDTDANLIWAANIGNGSVSGSSLIVDPFDDICITGTFSGTADFDPGATVSNLTSFGSSDIFVLKLSSAGSFVWVRKMGGTLSDIPNSIDSDASGNLVTTGSFMGTADFDPGVGTLNLTSAGSNDIFISKLDASGNLVWAHRIGSVSAFEAGYGITTDASDNVITTGQFSGAVDFDPGALVVNLTSAGNRDIFILKLDPVGNFVWAKNMGGLNTDVGYAITTDPGGNIYSTGYFELTADFDPGAASFNLTTLAEWEPFISKLDASGDFVWAISTQSSAGFFESEANSISLDPFDNIIIAGWFEGPMDFDPSSCTEILTSNSDEGFVIKFSPTSLPSCFPAITSFTPTAGPIGTTVTITGTNFSTTPTDNTVQFNGTTATVIASTLTSITTFVPSGASTGTIDVTIGANTAISSTDFIVSASSPNWVRKIGDTGSQNGEAIAIDGSGNSYTSGSFENTVDFNPGVGVSNLTAQSTDIFVVKLDVNGDFVWARNMGGPTIDEGLAIQLDGSGNIYVAGTFSGTADFDPGAGVFNLTSTGSRDIFIAKLDNDGNFIWAKSISGSSIKDLSAIALDATGNVYATGYFFATADFDPGAPVVNQTSAGSADIFVLKLDTDGNFIWASQVGSTGADFGGGITISASGNPYLTGDFEGTVDFDPGAGNTDLTSAGDDDIFIAKFDAGGNLLWAKSMGSTAFDRGHALITDASENVYTTGIFSNTMDFDPGAGEFNLEPGINDEDAFILKLNSDGDFVWAAQFGGPFGSTSPYSIGLDGSANTYIIGEAYDGDDGDLIIMAGFDSNGNRVFQDIADGFGSGKSIAANSSGDIYATGEFAGTLDFNLGDCLGSLFGVSDDAFILKTRANAFSTPTITSFSPTSGAEGTVVIITGTNFSTIPAINEVYFDGFQAIVTASTTTTITTSVPAGAVTGVITISTGCGTVTSGTNFTVVGPILPTITSFTPTSGPIGTTVTITGTDFSTTPADNVVQFNGTSAVVASSSTTSITTTVPAGATTGKITVTVAGNTATSATDFSVTTTSNQPPVFNSTQTSVPIAGTASIDLTLLISDVDNNIDLTTLRIITPPISGASAAITNSILTLDYAGLSFAGTDRLTIEVCDVLGSCTQQELIIEVEGDLNVYNGISPNGDLHNEVWIIQNIESLPDTRENKVLIYNRWGDLVFDIYNYDNDSRVFRGLNKNGDQLPAGIYFYKIEFASGRKSLTGYLNIQT